MSTETLKKIYIILAILIGVSLIGGCVMSSLEEKPNPAYDEDGFLGYSDDFWEWKFEYERENNK
ncbi:MAG: hypothetical protein J6R04_01965 [Clostridia bacterium]|nr:hypothetical protein [Clostridia bacterium]